MVNGRRMEPVDDEPAQLPRRRRIWTDAKATDDKAWIGGWQEHEEGMDHAEWFSTEVGEEMAPWLKSRGGSPKRVIAALEFLATIIALKLWMKDGEECSVLTEAFTDNQGNDFILRRGLSTKFPITLMVIEVSEMLRQKKAYATLNWDRREENEAADDLTNEVFTKFKEEKRRIVIASDIEWIVMDKLMKESEVLYTKIRDLKNKAKKKQVQPTEGRERMGRKTGKFFGRWST